MLPPMKGRAFRTRGWLTWGALALFLSWPGRAHALPDGGIRAATLRMLEAQARHLESVPRTHRFVLGDRAPGAARLLATVRALASLLRTDLDQAELDRAIEMRFERVSLSPQLMLTGYHLPLLEARDRPDDTFRYPLYARPSDLVEVDLGQHRSEWQGQTLSGRLRDGRLVPYPDRQAIEDRGALAAQGLEIAWVRDELDRYLLQVQGSGYLRDAQGRERLVRFAGTNGRAYRSLGQMLVQDGLIPPERVSVQAIREVLDRPGIDRHGYLVRNERFVFFQLSGGPATGAGNIPLTPGHSIASDLRVASAGLVGRLTFARPLPDASGSALTGSLETRFVGVQDTGAAIVGPGRADLFCGGGEDAAWLAGQLKASASLEFLLLKPEGETSR